MEFPRLVYKGPAVHIPVQNEDEHAEALKNGWYDNVPDALEAAKDVKKPDPAAVAAAEVVAAGERATVDHTSQSAGKKQSEEAKAAKKLKEQAKTAVNGQTQGKPADPGVRAPDASASMPSAAKPWA